jgi:hypothetical protein
MLAFLLPSYLTCRHTHTPTLAPIIMANQTPPPQRRWKQLYESLLLNIAEWQRESSYPSSSPLTETSHHPVRMSKTDTLNVRR